MSDVFISYDSDDRAIAQRFAVALESMGWTIWWDRQIPVGGQFDQVIEQELASARCVVVLWSKQSVASRWVRAEASAGAARNVLVPAMIEETSLPLEFRAVQTAMLAGWTGDTDDREFRRLTAAIAAHVPATADQAIPVPQARDADNQPKHRFPRVSVAVALVLAIGAGALIHWWPPSGDDPGAQGSAPASAKAGSAPTIFAGSIGTPGEVDTYTFDARRGRRIYFRAQSFAKELYGTHWKLVDEFGAEVFNSCLGCGDPGVKQLYAEGRYTLTVGGSKDSAIGAYELMMTDVRPVNRFDIAIGDTIGEGAPGPGAGTIESPGAENLYRFTATPLQRVFLRILESSQNASRLQLRLTDEDETVVSNTCLGCGDPGTLRLGKGGTYELVVGSLNTAATGTYRLRLTNVPEPHRFTVTVPARIAAGIPGEGAGLLEAPGAEDIYAFELPAQRSLSIKVLSHDTGLMMAPIHLLDAKDEEFARGCLGCGQPKVPANLAAGAYRVVIGGPKVASTGEYALEIGSP